MAFGVGDERNSPEQFAIVAAESRQRTGIQCDDRRASRSNRDEENFAVDDRRAVVAAAGGGAFLGFAAEEFHAPIFIKAGAPNFFAGIQLEATEFAVARSDVGARAVDDWRCA